MSAMHAEMAQLKTRAKEQTHSQKGSVLVEFVLILPVFLALVCGMITFSFALYDKTMLTMATREGARAGALYGTSDRENKADEAALAACEGLLITFGSGKPVVVVNSTISGNILTVKANYPYTGCFWNFISNDYDEHSKYYFDLSAQTSMRLEE